MSATGTNNTGKWTLSDGVLTISQVSGNSGIMQCGYKIFRGGLLDFIDLTDEERLSVLKVVFSGNVRFQRKYNFSSDYEFIKDVQDWFIYKKSVTESEPAFPNCWYLDLSGFNTAGVQSLSQFILIPELTTLLGLNSIDTSSCNNYSYMFALTGTIKLSRIDVSNFNNMNDINTNLSGMLRGMSYCSEVKLPSNFSRRNSFISDSYESKDFGLAGLHMQATNQVNGITVASDGDFFALPSGQGGTWIRDLSQSNVLEFNTRSSNRDGDTVTIEYSYTTAGSATADVYTKLSSASTYPSTPVETIQLADTGNGSIMLSLATDDAYDVMFIISDADTTLYVFANIDSNILLMEIDEDGDIGLRGRVDLKNYSFERDTGGTLNEGFRIVDKNGDVVAYMKGLSTLDSQDRTVEGFNIGTSRVVGGSTKWNALRMMIDADGSPVVTLGQVDAWLKALGLYEPTTPTVSLTNITTGSLQSITPNLYGKHMHLVLLLKNSAAVAPGSNLFVGTIAQTAYRPKAPAWGVGYYAGAVVVVQIATSGVVTARVIGATVPANGVVYTNVSFLIP